MGLLVVPFFRRTPEKVLGRGERGCDDENDGHVGGDAFWGHSVLVGSCLPARYFFEQNHRIVKFGKDH